jgi:hypothetical protein
MLNVQKGEAIYRDKSGDYCRVTPEVTGFEGFMGDGILVDHFGGKLQDSGNRTVFETGAVRDRPGGKGRYDLLPPEAIDRLAKHYENGAKKYADRNWEKGLPLANLFDSMLRHAFKLLAGETDEDHAAAVMWNVAGFITTAERIKAGKLPGTLADSWPHKL